jgi:uncharacterized protein (DUF302 family)
MGLSPEATTPAQNGLVTLKSAFPVKETVDRLARLVESKGLTVFCRIDHAANAVSAGLELRPTEVLIFGNAKGVPPLCKRRRLSGSICLSKRLRGRTLQARPGSRTTTPSG